jgi:citrate lyase subunit beta/citryl-CoA lyase
MPAALPLARWRSVLFVPGNDARRLRRALTTEAHLVVADWEDGTPPAEKVAARELTRRLYGETPAGGPARAVRVNAAGTGFHTDDIGALAGLRLDAVVLPKASPAALAAFPEEAPPVLAIVETALGLRDVRAIAESGRAACLALGAIDLGIDLGTQWRPDGQEVLLARSKLVLESACAGLRAPLDQVLPALDDAEQLAAEVALARSLGLRGKLCIHPRQLEAVNTGFGPTSAEVAWARELVDAFERAEADGRGALAVRGEMVDLPVVERARRVLGEAG